MNKKLQEFFTISVPTTISTPPKKNYPKRETVTGRPYVIVCVLYINNLKSKIPDGIFTNSSQYFNKNYVITALNRYENNFVNNTLIQLNNIFNHINKNKNNVFIMSNSVIKPLDVYKMKYYDYNDDKLYETKEYFIFEGTADITKAYRFDDKESAIISFDAYTQGFLTLGEGLYTQNDQIGKTTYGNLKDPKEINIKYEYAHSEIPEWQNLDIQEYEYSLTCYIKNLNINNYDNSYIATFNKDNKLCGVNRIINAYGLNGWKKDRTLVSNLITVITPQTVSIDYDLFYFKFYNADTNSIVNIKEAVIMYADRFSGYISAPYKVCKFKDYDTALTAFKNPSASANIYVDASSLDNLVELNII
jgi:hypothetical protein